MKTRKFSFSLRPYPVCVEVVLGAKPAENELARTEQLGNGAVAVKFAEYEPAIDVVVHEAVHVKQFVEKFVETEFDDETEAYFTEYVCKSILDRMERRGKK